MLRILACRAPRWVGATVAAAALAAACAAAPAPAQAAPNPGGPYAIHSMLQLNSPYVFKQAMFAAAAAAGASEIRVDASLGALNNPWIKPAMWQGLSDYMQLSQQYALPVLLDFNASNDISLETCQPGVDPNSGLCGVTNLMGYYDEVAAVVQYTRGVIDDFEIVNEPDGSWAFTGTAQQYAGMLATAYQAVHDNDPAGRVLLGGIMTPADMAWLGTVFSTPGYDAAHKFDVANIHLRDNLAKLPGEVVGWRRFFQFIGDGSVPLWVTETGYPSDPAYQYDPSFRGTDATSGQVEQAAYLAQALPALLYAGASRVFVTERDDMTGQFASEGLLGGQVTDADENNPNPVPKLAYSMFEQLTAQVTTPLPPAPPLPPPSPPASQSPPAPPSAAASLPGTPAAAATAAHGTTAAVHPASAASRKRPRPRPRRHRPARIARHGERINRAARAPAGRRARPAGQRLGPLRGR